MDLICRNVDANKRGIYLYVYVRMYVARVYIYIYIYVYILVKSGLVRVFLNYN
jgi:hypothetical protein